MTNTNNLYYHYCSLDTFYQIISTSTIRLSNPYKMNDTQEYKWLLNLLPQVIENFISKTEDEEERQRYREYYIETAKEIYDNYFQDKHPYIACFSKEGDILSQWRSYADNSRGVAIGFNLDEIIKNFSLETSEGVLETIEVEYDTQIQKKVLLDLLKENGLEDPNHLVFHRMKHMVTASMIVLDSILEQSIGYKNPAFREEKEVRLIYWPSERYSHKNNTSKIIINDIEFRNDNEKLISFFTLDFSEIKTDVIKSIYIGSNSKVRDNDLDLFLKKYGYNIHDSMIIPSLSTYR